VADPSREPALEKRPARPSAFLLLFAPIPGVGHWMVRRAGRGLLAFMVFALGLNLIAMATVMAPVAELSPVWGWALAGAAVAFSIVDVSRIVLGKRPASV
jgi:hypothetical protein